jgi:NADPH:quinone reductase-like Zn-dependent oxidoreductase
MGGMGREFDGGYQEFALLPASQVLPVKTNLEWPIFAALPETFLTAWRALHEGLEARKGEWLLVRGGSSSVGIATITLAKPLGMRIIATTRNPAKADKLKAAGADEVVIDTGAIAEPVRAIVPEGVDRVLELIGTVTLKDSLRTVRRKGVCCYAGLLGNEWTIREFSPMEYIPNTVRLSTYTTHDLNRENATGPLQQIVDGVAAGRFDPHVDRVFRFGEIAAAHRHMEENRATGKIVVMVD